MGKLRRCVRCIAVNKDDAYGIAGTTTGDMIKFSINYPSDPGESVSHCKPALIGCLAKCGPWKKGKRPESQCYSQGIESILIMDDGCLIVGAGDGTIDILDEINWKGGFPKGKIVSPNQPYFKALKTCKLLGCITSLELLESPHLQGDKRLLLAGTRTSEIYAINVVTFTPLLVVTCHRCAINDIAFPRGMSGVFATAGAGDIRVWCLETCQELLRIAVPNFTCAALLFSADGKSIVSAWNDGCIRSFTPLTGRLIYCIYNTHNKGTSAIGMTKDGKTLVSGGCEGQVRVWEIKPQYQNLKKVLKEHKSPVSAIQVSPNDTEAVSAGTDGSCIIWDLL
ncbi:cilia- and flagella-associated protein 52 [Hyposmocoma kahamanoa]|uniref:cilia- and flagella-associated protein 52 n=1 Tax=Hyposmocoma kahamanoa TaxID=1477025 RepID=UPI000E6D7D3E|nr:cilia- and flagella-associated protein 52 [Hyposmocoma kahamanoa]